MLPNWQHVGSVADRIIIGVLAPVNLANKRLWDEETIDADIAQKQADAIAEQQQRLAEVNPPATNEEIATDTAKAEAAGARMRRKRAPRSRAEAA